MAKVCVSLSKGKGKGNKSARSSFLSKFMKAVSGELGDKIVSAFDNQDAERFEKAILAAAKKVSADFKKG